MELFDEWVDALREGDTLIANYDTGLQVKLNYESLTISDDDTEVTLSDSDLLELIRAFLEAYMTAREAPLEINYDELLNGLN